jgi:uncharacterized repeat protein (TIGR01451 family)
MKKFFLYFIIFNLHFLTLKAQWVTIPDPNFVNRLTQLFPSCMNGNQLNTSCSQVLSTSMLNVKNQNIADLSGVEHFVNLIDLNCSNNQLVSLPTLNNNLKYLTCKSNLLTSITQLPDSLLSLSCDSNAITSLPTLPNNLNSLLCSHNQLTTLPVLPFSLFGLNCSYNQLSTIPPVSAVMALFLVNNNNITCFNFLPLLPTMAPVNSGNISGNPLTCVPNLVNYIYNLPLPVCVEDDPINNPNNCISTDNISGYVFVDQNNNCQFDSVEGTNNNILVKLYNNANVLIAQKYTNSGQYSFIVNAAGNYKVKVDLFNLPVQMSCAQADSQIVNLVSPNIGVSNINFPLACATVAEDIKINYVTTVGWVFPGIQHHLNTNISDNANWHNFNCLLPNYDGTVSIEVTGPVSFYTNDVGSLTPTVNGNTFTYNISSFNSLTPESFGLILKTDTTAQSGDMICVHVEITPNPTDLNTLNNVYDYCYFVSNSYDPNMKEVYPVNVLPGYDDWFTYTIHFQNTGNAPAFNIRLKDTLDANLDINSFEMLGYSHPALISINGNILTVRFNNIMLPDSTSDYEGSMGYFQYRLKPLVALPVGTQIENTAYIYFDYNAPIVTNTTINNVAFPVKVNNAILEETNYTLYPNPSTGIFMFNPDSYQHNKNIKTVEVFNMMGEIVLSQGNTKVINLQGYPKGIYVARINGMHMCRLVKE